MEFLRSCKINLIHYSAIKFALLTWRWSEKEERRRSGMRTGLILGLYIPDPWIDMTHFLCFLNDSAVAPSAHRSQNPRLIFYTNHYCRCVTGTQSCVQGHPFMARPRHHMLYALPLPPRPHLQVRTVRFWDLTSHACIGS